MKDQKSSAFAFRETIKIWPHRSLSKRGFAIVMIALGSLAFAIGVGFFLLGAWPVFGFLGVEFLVVWIAFKLNYRAAKKKQLITVTDKELQVQTTYPNGQIESNALPAAWVKVSVSPHATPTIKSRYQQKIIASSHGKSIVIGDFVHPAETPGLARHVSGMVDRAKDAAIAASDPDAPTSDQPDGRWPDDKWADTLDETTLRPN